MPILTGSRAVADDGNHVVFSTELPLRSRWHALRFVRDAFAIRRLLDSMLDDPGSGLVRYELRAQPLANRYATESVWQSQVHLRRFAAHPVHSDVVRRQAQRVSSPRFSVHALTDHG